MIRRELPLTVIASPVEPCRIGQARIPPSCLLQLLLALCSRWMARFIKGRFCFFLISGKLLLLFLSGCGSLADGRLCSGSNSPDESQQFTSNCSNDLSLGLAGRTQFHIALVQAVLSLPSNLLDLFGNALLSFAQTIPNNWWTTVAPRCFANDSSQV